MEKEKELYNYEQVIAYAIIGLNNLLHSANKDDTNLKDYARLFMEPLPQIYKKEDVIAFAEIIQKRGKRLRVQAFENEI